MPPIALPVSSQGVTISRTNPGLETDAESVSVPFLPETSPLRAVCPSSAVISHRNCGQLMIRPSQSREMWNFISSPQA